MSFFGETEARYAALSGLIHDARVLDLTEHVDGRCIDSLVTAGARSVTVCAPESVRDQLTTHSADLTLTPPIDLPLQFAPSSFDVVICFDLVSRMVRDSRWASALHEVLEPDGAIVMSSVSAEDATRILGPTFGVATVFAQTPLVGHMLYDTEADELDPELDRTWADGDSDEPTRYVVVFAPDKRHSEKLTLVQMPFGKWEEAARAELAQVKREHEATSHELATLREQIETNQRQLGSAGGEIDTTRTELQNAQQEIELLVAEVAGLRGELDAARAGDGASALAEELGRHRNDRASLEAQIADLLQESGAFSEHRLEWQARLDSVEGDLVAERARVAELTAQTVSTAANGAELEERLSREAGRSIALDQEVAAERLRASELEAGLAEDQARIADLQGQLDAALRAQSRAAESNEALARSNDAEERLRQERDTALADLDDAIRARDQAHERADAIVAEREAAIARADDIVQRYETARLRVEEYQGALESEREVSDELRRGLETERTRSDELRRTADTERERMAELTRELDEERRKRRDLETRNAAAAEAEELLSQARLETVEAVEALRQERVRGEQLLTRLVDLEQRLTPHAKKSGEESAVSSPSEGETGSSEKTVVTRDLLPPGQDAIDGKS